MSGAMAGLDWPAALARAQTLAPHEDQARIAQLMEHVEAGAMEAAARRAEEEGGK